MTTWTKKPTADEWLAYGDALEEAVRIDPGHNTQFYLEEVTKSRKDKQRLAAARTVLHHLAELDRVHQHASSYGRAVFWWPVASECNQCARERRITVPTVPERLA